MHNHGLLAAGRTVAEAFYHLYILENACKVQVDVLTSGANYKVPTKAALEAIGQFAKLPEAGPAKFVTTSWDAVLRMLERDGIEWKV